ncbi:MAG: ABC transporter permease [Gracilibacteraceae bacterium]|jgi:ABC-2 type transport system permease protein|nr:ABC transporter permease [Gracilibacteraceae bacterium]
MINIAERIIKQMVHDKRSLAMIIIVPLFLLTLLYLLLAKSSYVPVVATENLPASFMTMLEEQDTIRLAVKDVDETIETFLKKGKADAVISQDEEGLRITFVEMDGVKVNAVTDALKSVVSVAAGKSQPETNIDFIFGKKDQSMFDSLGFLLLSVLSFFMIFLFSGISFVRERTSDTLERLMLTPIKTVSVVGGYVLGFGFFAVIQSVLMLIYAKILGMPFVGSWLVAALIMLLLAVLAVVTGVLISAISRNEFQVMQFIPIIIIPQIFFSGLIPVDTLPFKLNYLSKIMPLYYGSEGLKGVLVYGYGFGRVMPQIVILLCFIAAVFAANVFVVERYRA